MKMTLLLGAGGLVGSALGVFGFRALRSVGQLDLIIALVLRHLPRLHRHDHAAGIGARAVAQPRSGRAAASRPPGQHNWIHGLPLKTRFRRSKLYVSVIPIVALGAGIGFLGSVLGLGGGFIMVPALIYLLRVPTNVVIGTSLAYTLVTMAVGDRAARHRQQVRRHHAGAAPDGRRRGRRAVRRAGRPGAARRAAARAAGAARARRGDPRPARPVPDAGPDLFAERRWAARYEAAACPSLALASALLLPARRSAESLVSTLSDDAVEITSNFTGEQIVVFGAVRGVPADDPDYQVAIVVQGPAQDVVVRQKERVLGIWANRDSREFADVPSYYVMHLSENFSATLIARRPRAVPARRAEPPVRAGVGRRRDRAALRRGARSDLKSARGLYAERESEVEFLAPNVFRTTFFLPSDIPTGEYRVSVYLFRGETFLAGADADADDREGRLFASGSPAPRSTTRSPTASPAWRSRSSPAGSPGVIFRRP